VELDDVEQGRAVKIQIRKKGFAIVSKYLDFEKESDRVLDLKLVEVGGGHGETRKPEESKAEPVTNEPPGFLVANTQPWAKVFVDGRDTGKSTPIAPLSKLTLKPGKHTVTFVVDGKKYNFPIEVKSGEVTRLIKTLGDE